MKHKRIEPELSRPLTIDKIPPAGIEETIIASAAEREVGVASVSAPYSPFAVAPTYSRAWYTSSTCRHPGN